MATKISRAKLARYATEQLVDGNDNVIQELAAYLIENRRVDELDLIVREISEQFERRGVVAVDIVSARPIEAELRAQIAKLLGAEKLEANETIDAKLLGGVKLETASRRLDATVAHRLEILRSPSRLKEV